MYQFEIDELKTALDKEQHEKQQLKNILDEFEATLADIAGIVIRMVHSFSPRKSNACWHDDLHFFCIRFSPVSTAKEIQTLKEDNKRLSEGKSDTEDAFMQIKIRYDELRSLNLKHVEVFFFFEATRPVPVCFFLVSID